MNAPTIQSVVVCADDFGFNAPVSQGIVALAVLGRISATSVLVHSPRWAEDAASLSEMRQRLDVGLHLDWSSPLVQAQPHGMTYAVAALRAGVRLMSLRRLQDEMECQLDLFEKHWKDAPQFLSAYDHVHQLPRWREALALVLSRRYGRRSPKPWVRVAHMVSPSWRAKWYNLAGGAALQRWCQEQRWPMGAPLMGLYDFKGGIGQYGRHMQQWLSQIPTATAGVAVVACHPALSAQFDDPIGVARSREFAYLVGHDFVQHLREAGVRLVRASGAPMTDI